MRVLFLSPVGFLGGAEVCLLSAIASLRRSRPAIEPHLLVGTDGPLIQRARDLGISAQLLAMPAQLANLGDSAAKTGRAGAMIGLAARSLGAAPAAYRYARAFRRAVAEIDPDVVHSNGLKTHLLTKLLPSGQPIAWHIHDFISTRPVIARALSFAAPHHGRLIAISNAVCRDAEKTLPQLPVDTVLNGIDTARFSPDLVDASWLDTAAGLPPAAPDTLRVGLVATFARWKGQDVFLQAAQQVLATVSAPVRFYIVGGAIYHTRGSQFSEPELRSLAAQLNIANHVGFVGFQSDTANVFRSLDVCVHASTQPEPFGLTIVEAMSCGRPVVVSNAGGAAELFSDGQTALAATPGDPASFAAAITRLVTNPTLRDTLSENARRHALKNYSDQRLGPELAAVYYRLLETSDPDGAEKA